MQTYIIIGKEYYEKRLTKTQIYFRHHVSHYWIDRCIKKYREFADRDKDYYDFISMKLGEKDVCEKTITRITNWFRRNGCRCPNDFEELFNKFEINKDGAVKLKEEYKDDPKVRVAGFGKKQYNILKEYIFS